MLGVRGGRRKGGGGREGESGGWLELGRSWKEGERAETGSRLGGEHRCEWVWA